METSLTLNDLSIVVNIIDVCAARGAFKGPEMLEVGQLREKIIAAINVNKAATSEEKDVIEKEKTGE